MSVPLVAIVGRPNVGKSTLFNRLLGRRQAIESDVAGTTRDRIVAEASWEERRILLVDTGGLEVEPEEEVRQKAQEQAQMAIDEASVILFLTDVTEGVTPTDHAIADKLRRTKKPVILAVNKVDNDTREMMAAEFHQLGMRDMLPISAYHNLGVWELMDRVVELLLPTAAAAPLDAAPDGAEKQGEGPLKLAIIGRTNVGKSQLLNTILGEERSIVSEIAGTTRDAIDTPFSFEGQEMVVIDTAGIRRPGQVTHGAEKYSVLRAINAVNRCDIALLVMDGTEPATAQDLHITGLTWDMCRGLIAVVNKWDLMGENPPQPQSTEEVSGEGPSGNGPFPLGKGTRLRRDTVSARRGRQRGRTIPSPVGTGVGATDDREEGGTAAKDRADQIVRERMHFMPYVPICFTSALYGEGIDELLRTALGLWRERLRFIPANKLQFMLTDALSGHAPPPVKGHRHERLRIDQLRQVGVNPPTFIFSANNPDLVHFSYQRYLENRIREAFGFNHTHLKLIFRRRGQAHAS